MRTIYAVVTFGILAEPIAGQGPVVECRGVLGSAQVTLVRQPDGPDPLNATRLGRIFSLPRSVTDGTGCTAMVGPDSPTTFVGLPEGRYSLDLMWSGLDPIEFAIRDGQDTTIVIDGPATNRVRDCEAIEACRDLLLAGPEAPEAMALEAHAFHLAITLGTQGQAVSEAICLRGEGRDPLIRYLQPQHPTVRTREVCSQPPRDKAYVYLSEIQPTGDRAAVLRIAYRMARSGALWGTDWRCFVEREAGGWTARQCVVSGMM